MNVFCSSGSQAPLSLSIFSCNFLLALGSKKLTGLFARSTLSSLWRLLISSLFILSFVISLSLLRRFYSFKRFSRLRADSAASLPLSVVRGPLSELAACSSGIGSLNWAPRRSDLSVLVYICNPVPFFVILSDVLGALVVFYFTGCTLNLTIAARFLLSFASSTRSRTGRSKSSSELES